MHFSSRVRGSLAGPLQAVFAENLSRLLRAGTAARGNTLLMVFASKPRSFTSHETACDRYQAKVEFEMIRTLTSEAKHTSEQSSRGLDQRDFVVYARPETRDSLEALSSQRTPSCL